MRKLLKYHNKGFFSPKIVDTTILNITPEVKYEPLVVCNQYVITFGTGKINFTLQHVDYMERYPLETTGKEMKLMKYNLLVTNN